MSLPQLVKSTYESSIKGAYRPGVANDLAFPVPGAWDIFTIIGGPVLITQLWGLVTVVINGAAVPQLMHDPDGAAPNANIAQIMLTMDADNPGAIYTWTGAVGVRLIAGAQLGVQSVGETLFAGNYLMLVPGVINFTNGVTATGIVDWYVNYIPCYPGAHILPA